MQKSINELKTRAGDKVTAVPEVVSVHDSAEMETAKLAARAKGLRGVTEKRFAEVIDGWRRQNDSLQQELEIYQNQERVSQDRVQKRNTEIKQLRSENEKLTNLLRKCEERINQLFDIKEREQMEKKRANKLADQLFDHKKMIGDLQAQLKEAEKLLATTKHERNNLLVENHALKKSNAELRRELLAAEQDTQQTKVELEMIEDMVQSIDCMKAKASRNMGSSNYLESEIKPRKAPSAQTALNMLAEHHKAGIHELTDELTTVKLREMSDQEEIKKLQSQLHDLTG